MQRYWLRIALGAAAVFAVGMGVITLTRNSITELRALAASTRPISIPIMIMPFRLEGAPIGTVRRVDILRRTPKDFSGIRLAVRLDDSVVAARLPSCSLTIDAPEEFASGNGFQCVGSADSATQHLKKIGEIAFEPSGVDRALFAPADQADSWRSFDDAKTRAQFTTLQGKDWSDSGVRAIIQADSNGALIDVGSGSGRKLVHIRADSHGASLQVRDKSGRKLVQLQADPAGAKLSVLADSANPAR